MAEYDVVIRGGTIVEGTGVPRYQADLAVKDGRIAKISGNIRAGAAKEIDASGCIVAPGAVDLHTHYDAQLNWDPYATLSGWFGVTSLSIGQCGFGFAPTKAEDRELNMRMMNRIEAIPLESMRLGLRWDWETFPEYLDSLDRQGLGVNVGSLIPFSPLRGYVLGMLAARERRSMTDKELNQMKQIFYEGMQAGGFGFAADNSVEDHPEDGGFLPSHVASEEEYLALAEIMGEFGVGHIGWTIGFRPMFDDRGRQENLLKKLLKASGRKAHVNGLGDDPINFLQGFRDDGYTLLGQLGTLAPDAQFKLADYNLMDVFANWVQPLIGTAEERAAKLRDPSVREAMKRDIEEPTKSTTQAARGAVWNLTVVEVMHERNQQYEGLTIGQIAEAQQKHPLDAFLDLALDENLQTEFSQPQIIGGIDEERLAKLIKSPHTHISLSDGGAHIRYLSIAMWPVWFLSHWIRDNELMSLEEAHIKMSAFPAWFADFKDRGSLRIGSWADVMIYDLEKLGFLYDKPIYANDFPGGERRVIQKPKGIRYILVNGTVTFEGNDCTGALPGKLLRSYDMVS